MLLDSLQQRSDAGTDEVQALIGITYRALGTYFGASREESEAYLEQATTAFQRLHDQSPDNVNALLGLSSLAETRDERIDHLRQAVETDPSNQIAVQTLSNALHRLGMPGVRESINSQQQAYVATDHADEAARWRLAYGISVDYRVLLLQLEASYPSQIAEVEGSYAAFLEQIRQDLRWEEVLADASREPANDPERIAANLSIVCRHYARSMFGARDCIGSVLSVADAAATIGGTDTGLRLADAVDSSIRSVALDEFGVDAGDADWYERFAAAAQRMMASGAQTPGLYVAYAYMKPYMGNMDPDEMLTVLQRGSVRFPDHRDVAGVLMGEYLERGLRDEALAQARIYWGEGRMQEAEAYVDEWLAR